MCVFASLTLTKTLLCANLALQMSVIDNVYYKEETAWHIHTTMVPSAFLWHCYHRCHHLSSQPFK